PGGVEQRRKRLAQAHHHRAGVGRLDGGERGQCGALRGADGGIEDGIVRRLHVRGSDPFPAGEAKVLTQLENEGPWIGRSPCAGERGDARRSGSAARETGVQQVCGAARRHVRPETRVEALWLGVEGDDDARLRRRSALTSRNHAGEKRQEPEFLGQLFDSTVVRLVRTIDTSVRMRRGRGNMRSALILAFAIVPGPPGAAGSAARLPGPPEIEAPDRFLEKGFPQVLQGQVLNHDPPRLDKIYTVIDFRPYVDQGYRSFEIDQIRKDTTDGEIM